MCSGMVLVASPSVGELRSGVGCSPHSRESICESYGALSGVVCCDAFPSCEWCGVDSDDASIPPTEHDPLSLLLQRSFD